ncbi:MAG: hypothetical protein ACR2N5_00275 [Solirubrobacterales bacterium]
MFGFKRAGLSPSMLVAIVALVAALGGSALAEVSSTSKLSKPEKKKVAKLAKKKAKKLDKKQDKKNFPVGTSQIADGAVTSSKIDGVPRAWANVLFDGTFRGSKGISTSDITKGGTGKYCVDGKFDGTTAQATGGYYVDGLIVARAIDPESVPGGAAVVGCPATSSWIVQIQLPSGSFVDADFTLAFYE